MNHDEPWIACGRERMTSVSKIRGQIRGAPPNWIRFCRENHEFFFAASLSRGNHPPLGDTKDQAGLSTNDGTTTRDHYSRTLRVLNKALGRAQKHAPLSLPCGRSLRDATSAHLGAGLGGARPQSTKRVAGVKHSAHAHKRAQSA